MKVSSPRTKTVVATMVAALVLSVFAATAQANHDGTTPRVEIDQSDSRERDGCSFFQIVGHNIHVGTGGLFLYKAEDDGSETLLYEDEFRGSSDSPMLQIEIVDEPEEREDMSHPVIQVEEPGPFVGVITFHDGEQRHEVRSGPTTIECEEQATAPDCPANPRAEALDDGSVRLTWDAVEGAEQYHIYRGTNEVPWTIYDSTEETTFLDTETEPEVTYVYQVRTFSNGQESPDTCESVQVTAIPFLGAPVVGALAAIGAVGAYAWAGRRRKA